MKSRPILFSAPMVRAILEGRKTQTRRVVKPQGAILSDDLSRKLGVRPPTLENTPVIACPYGEPGDRLWVKETWRAHEDEVDGAAGILYRADGAFIEIENTEIASERWCSVSHLDRWRPSIFMPRWASRITLEIVGVRVERLNAISESDAIAEGITWPNLPDGRNFRPPIDLTGISNLRIAADRYRELWESINGTGSWEKNPWVWVIEFRRVGQ